MIHMILIATHTIHIVTIMSRMAITREDKSVFCLCFSVSFLVF
jgi:hypothetical protein